MYCSSFQMVAISFDRYQAICRPLAHYRTDRYRRPNCLALTAWLLALACSLPQIFVWTLKNGQCSTIYNNHISLRKAYVIYFNTVAWLLPSLLAAIFYYFVCKTVWRSQCERVPSYSSGKQETNQKVSYRTRDYVNKLRKKSLGLRNQSSEFDRKRIQTVRLTLTIVACNFFLWAPYCLMNAFMAFFPSLVNSYGNVITYILILGNLNSCVNPWIYILFNGRITKRALTSIVDSGAAYSPSNTRITQKRSSEAITMNNGNFQRASIISNSIMSKNYVPRTSLSVDIAKTQL
uniref:G-protein coupled receptors family 1 profile domain-containing protein n=1 Tax=Panagrolaimus sp. PS1159 TaxID=55785 RepID=A0AC35F762_9BILA